jgi:flagella basal body P-ring formation protein FlgA
VRYAGVRRFPIWARVRLLTTSADEVADKSAGRAIRAGEPIPLAQLGRGKEVRAGDTVMVDVKAGGVRLAMEAKAEGSGAAGDVIAVRNPETRRRFQARVEARGRVSVSAAGNNR